VASNSEPTRSVKWSSDALGTGHPLLGQCKVASTPTIFTMWRCEV
jgi:hypothetical protein